jgi:asparagine synthase (glutamine-hydrolysing)
MSDSSNKARATRADGARVTWRQELRDAQRALRMCGICGFVGGPDRPTLARMAAVLAHRGPDDSGFLVRPEVSLAVRRLSIVDLVHGRQPMTSEDGAVAVVFNGEIYNAEELRAELTVRGHRLATHCDTEVLPHLYEEYGDEFVTRLDGQFAIGLWDAARQRLVLTRDRPGIRPLFYAEDGGRFIFGSEIKSVRCALRRPPTINPEALYHYLSLKYVPGPLTIYAGVRSLRPGEQAVFERGRVTTRRYWSLEDAPQITAPDAEAVDRLEELLLRSVRGRLIADVPVGVLLSGGLDSSLILALAAGLVTHPIKTFTLGYVDDLPHKQRDVEAARWVARELGTQHYEYKLSHQEFAEDLPAVLAAFDEPFAGVVSPYYLCKLVRQHVKVCLSGDGADELFGSYLTHRLAQPIHNVQVHGQDAVRARPELAAPCADDLERVLRLARLPEWEWRAALGVFTDAEKRDLLNPEVADFARFSTAEWLRAELAACPHADPQNRQQHLDCRTLLPDLVLNFNDKLSMAHSIETRVPFLYHRLMEFASGVPGHMKIRRGRCKWLLKEVGRRWLPAEIVDRPKEGFVPPVNDWQRGAFRPLIENTLTAERLAAHGFFRPEQVGELVRRYYAGDTGLQYKVWSLFCFQVWFEHVAAPAADAVATEAAALLAP